MMNTSSIAFAWKMSLGTVLCHVKIQSMQVMECFYLAKKVGSFFNCCMFFCQCYGC